MSLCLPRGYTPNPEPAYYTDDTRVVWQPDLYETVAADPRCASTILDLGCGAAGKAIALQDRYTVVGVDHGENLHRAITAGLILGWELDLESQWPRHSPAGYRSVTIICADVIEHLRDPTRLLEGLAEAHNAGCPLIAVSSPDRDLVHGPGHRGPPANPCHAREWSAAEFVTLFASYGMAAEQSWTRSSTLAADQHTTLLLVGR